jgi:hypothetical protein
VNPNFVSSGSAVIAIPMSNEQTPHLFYELKRGVSLPDEWFTGKIPNKQCIIKASVEQILLAY